MQSPLKVSNFFPRIVASFFESKNEPDVLAPRNGARKLSGVGPWGEGPEWRATTEAAWPHPLQYKGGFGLKKPHPRFSKLRQVPTHKEKLVDCDRVVYLHKRAVYLQ